jgi:hypothetical protein
MRENYPIGFLKALFDHSNLVVVFLQIPKGYEKLFGCQIGKHRC